MQENLKVKSKSINISLTAYRAIKILKFLMEKPCSHSEIIDYLKSDEITCRSLSDDTLRITMNSLKTVGCKIARPCPANNYKYILQEHPFSVKFSEKELKILHQIREKFLKQSNWLKVLELNDLYDKLMDYSKDENARDILNKNRPFAKIQPKVLEMLKNNQLEQKEIIMTYSTSSKKVGVIDVVSDRVFCEGKKLYLMGWYEKRKKYSYFNFEKIREIHSLKQKSIDENLKTIAKYKILGDEIFTFKVNSDEKIIEQTKDYIFVESIVKSEFKFLQRILSFGADFELIEPKSMKIALKEKLSKIKARYEL